MISRPAFYDYGDLLITTVEPPPTWPPLIRLSSRAYADYCLSRFSRRECLSMGRKREFRR